MCFEAFAKKQSNSKGKPYKALRRNEYKRTLKCKSYENCEQCLVLHVPM